MPLFPRTDFCKNYKGDKGGLEYPLALSPHPLFLFPCSILASNLQEFSTIHYPINFFLIQMTDDNVGLHLSPMLLENCWVRNLPKLLSSKTFSLFYVLGHGLLQSQQTKNKNNLIKSSFPYDLLDMAFCLPFVMDPIRTAEDSYVDL